MSIRNQRTGRHEDDLAAAASRNRGIVGVKELLEHLDECVVDCGFGANVEDAVATLTETVRQIAAQNSTVLDLENAEVALLNQGARAILRTFPVEPAVATSPVNCGTPGCPGGPSHSFGCFWWGA